MISMSGVEKMKAIIENFMGCRSAEIKAEKIALIIGMNAQGKTSSLLPVSLALSGHSVPPKMTKTNAGMLVHSGYATARVIVEADGSMTEINWPKCEVRSVGTNPPKSSEFASGLRDFISLDDKEKIEILRSILKCEPTEAETTELLVSQGIEKNVAALVWQNIDRDGWDASMERAREKGKSFKSQWDYLTGEHYGEKKAASWFPDGWESDLQTMSRETLEAAVTSMRAELEYKIANQALDEDELRRLEEEASKEVDLASEMERLSAELEKAEKDLAAVGDRLAKIPNIPTTGLPCPHCGKSILLDRGRLVSAETGISDEQKSKIEQARLDANNEHSFQVKRVSELRTSYVTVQASLKASQKAKADLDKKSEAVVSPDEIDRFREEERKAECRLSAFIKYTEALRLHQNVTQNQMIIDALSPSGLRRKALERGLDAFNDALSSICRKAGWADVCIQGDMTVLFNGRPYVLCSASEKMRASFTIQTAIAEYDGSDAVVIDATDILDPKGRGGMLRVLANAPFASFVGMMVPDKDKVPSLSNKKIGHVYWLDQGKCEEV